MPNQTPHPDTTDKGITSAADLRKALLALGEVQKEDDTMLFQIYAFINTLTESEAIRTTGDMLNQLLESDTVKSTLLLALNERACDLLSLAQHDMDNGTLNCRSKVYNILDYRKQTGE